MLFDFKKTFASRSNEELVQIIAHPDGYQPEAVTAARDLLDERGLTPEDLQLILHPPQPATILNVNTVSYEDGKTDIFNELFRRMPDQMVKQLSFICWSWGIVAGLDLLGRLYSYGVRLSRYSIFRPSYTIMFISLLINILPFLGIYYLRKKRELGWKLSVLMIIFGASSLLSGIYYLLKTVAMGVPVTTYWPRLLILPPLAIYITCAVFLLSRPFRAFYNISRRQLIGYVAGAVIGFIIYFTFLLY